MSSHYEAPIRKPLVLGDKSYADISNDIARPVETPPDRDWWIAFSISMVVLISPVLMIFRIFNIFCGKY